MKALSLPIPTKKANAAAVNPLRYKAEYQAYGSQAPSEKPLKQSSLK